MIRVIGGKLRGRKLKSPKGLATRPVLGRVREALFNVLGDIGGYRILDLYAGTGAVGIEALSRGAESAVFVDSGFRQCGIISENLVSLSIEGEVIRSGVIKALEKFGAANRSFDFVFADPPYERGLGIKTLRAVFERDLISDKGIMALTVCKTEAIPDMVPSGEKVFDRRYGDTRLIMYAKLLI